MSSPIILLGNPPPVTDAAPLRTHPDRLLSPKSPDELLLAHATLAAHETNFVDVSPEQRVWFMGARAALAWSLGLPQGGRMIARLVDGVPLTGVLPALPSAEFFRGRYNSGETL